MCIRDRCGSGRTVAVVEDWLEKKLAEASITSKRVSQTRYLEQYGSENFVIDFDIEKLIIQLRRGAGDTELIPPSDEIDLGDRFTRNYGFWSQQEQDALRTSRVAIAGVGGDGYQLGLSLVRMGVRSLTIADPEVFEVENMNRVPGARVENIGRLKTDCFVEDARRIDPDVSIHVLNAGVDKSNVRELVDGADLVLDESELTSVELGAMISDEARRQNVPVLIVMNVGFAGQVTAFDPAGPGYREMMGIPDDEPIDAVAKRTLDLSRCLAYVPPYADPSALGAVLDGAPLPSIVQGVNQAVALGSSQAFLWLTRSVLNNRPAPVAFPSVQFVDSLSGESRIVDSVVESYGRSLTDMAENAAAGKNPIVTYPALGG